MCGIVVHVGNGAPDAALDAVRVASARLRHRGPDDSGLLVFSPHDAFAEDDGGRRRGLPPSAPGAATIVMAARRLAILDRSERGHQPMVDSDGQCAVVLNGEIYNYLELRAELSSKGHAFRSESDTEVLLSAYREWGPECIERLLGMFAFAIADRRTGRVLLARDRFGMKPLFYARHADGWLFASEIDALLEATGARRRANPQVIVDYLATGVTGDGTGTVFAEIAQVPPAHSIDWLPASGDGPAPRPYWAVDPGREIDVSFEEATEMVREAFLRSVQLHMRSDVPVGLMLSGGTDSSSVAMAMREVGGSSLDIHTFSYIGTDGATNEEPWIDEVNRAAGATAHKLRLRPEEWSNKADRVRFQAEPVGSLAPFAQGRLYEMAAGAGVPVALSGQGGDEVFAGYSWHGLARLRSLIEGRRPAAAVRFARSLHRSGVAYPSIGRHVVASVLPGRAAAAARSARFRHGWIAEDYCARHTVSPRTAALPRGVGRLRSSLLHGQSFRLPILLRYEDRNSMEHSVEGRLPFLTAPLVELALTLPEAFLFGPGGQGKHVLKEAMRGLVPDSVLERRDRIGFDVPLRRWATEIPEVADLIRFGLTLPPVHSPRIRPVLRRIEQKGELTNRDCFLAWRVVGLADWARHFHVIFD